MFKNVCPYVQGGPGNEDRKTLSKIKVDLAAFCSEETSPMPQEVFLQLK